MYYNVTMYANRPNATYPDYGQWYIATDDEGRFAGGYLPVQTPVDRGDCVPVKTVMVFARCAVTACRKMQHWQNEGLDAAWLLLPNNDDERQWPTYQA